MPKRQRRSSTEPAAAAPETLEELLAQLQSNDADARTVAWRSAGRVGASAVQPLADLTDDKSMEVARAAKCGMWQVVRDCGRPGDDGRGAIVNELVQLLADSRPVALRREILWMLSEIGDDRCVQPMAVLLVHPELREDARMTIERIPGNASLDALKAALVDAPDDFRPALAESLRRRGESIDSVPSLKKTPVKSTAVQPL